MKNWAIWSANYNVITGQALVTSRVVSLQPCIRWCQYIYSGAGWRSVFTWASASVRLWRDIARGRLAAIYIVCSRSNGGFIRDIPALLAACTGLRVVVHSHGSDIVDLLSARRISFLARALYARCEIIVPSTHLVQPLREIIGGELHLCENYFARESPSSKSIPDCDPNSLTVLWNSNVMASKGFFDLADAVRQLHQSGLSVRILSIGQVLGDDEMSEREAERRLDEILAFEWFDYRGKVDQLTAIDLLAQADVVCLPSRAESQGIAVIEGMCAGKAIVATDIPALRATLRGYPANFVPVRSVAAIFEALRALQEQKDANPSAFAASLQEPAAVARERFAAARFDREIAEILRGNVEP